MDSEYKMQQVLDALADHEDPRHVPDHMKSEEEKLREEFPGLQDLWDQYQVMLKLCKDSKPKPKTNQTASDVLAQIRARQAKHRTQSPLCTDNPCDEIAHPNDILARIRSKK